MYEFHGVVRQGAHLNLVDINRKVYVQQSYTIQCTIKSPDHNSEGYLLIHLRVV
jgi:hypothetical protein